MDHAIVFFCALRVRPSRRRGGIASRYRMARRFPRKTWYWLLTRAIQRFGGSDLCHVAIGYGGAVLDPSIQGNRYWPRRTFIETFPGLVYAVEVPLATPIDLDAVLPGRPKPVIPTLLRWWTGGRWQTDDCVCTVVNLLRAGGVAIDPKTYRPIDLFRRLQPHARRTIDFSPAG